MSGDVNFLTNQDGSLPDLNALKATDVGQYAKVGVDRALRAKLVKVVGGQSPVATDSGLSRFRATNLDEVAQAIKASAGNVYGIKFINPNTVAANVKFYNIAAAGVTVGVSPVLHTVPVPANDGKNDGVTWFRPDAILMSFDTAISIAVVTTRDDSGNTGLPSDLIAEVFYK